MAFPKQENNMLQWWTYQFFFSNKVSHIFLRQTFHRLAFMRCKIILWVCVCVFDRSRFFLDTSLGSGAVGIEKLRKKKKSFFFVLMLPRGETIIVSIATYPSTVVSGGDYCSPIKTFSQFPFCLQHSLHENDVWDGNARAWVCAFGFTFNELLRNLPFAASLW